MSNRQTPERFEIEPPSRATPTMPAAKKRGCWWIAIPVGCLAVLLVCGGFVGSIFFGVTTMLKSSEPFQRAVQLASDDLDVQEALGENITPGWSVQGSIQVDNGEGEVDMVIPLSGSKGSGQVHVRGTRESGQWIYEKIEFSDSSGNRIDLNSSEPADNDNSINAQNQFDF